MLVSATEMLKKAKAGHYAVGQFNINNLEWTKSILLTAQECNSPVILGVSEGAGKYMAGFETVAAMVKAMDEELGINRFSTYGEAALFYVSLACEYYARQLALKKRLIGLETSPFQG